MIEVWKNVPSITSLQASSLGRIRRFDNGHIYKQHINKHGYLKMRHSINGKRKEHRVHRLVCEAFHGCSDLFVLHADGDKRNNKPSNLYWGTQKQNIKDREKHGNTMRHDKHYARVINKKTAKRIKGLLSKGFTAGEVEKMTGVAYHIIYDIKRGKTWNKID